MLGLTEYQYWLETPHESEMDAKTLEWIKQHPFYERQENGKWRETRPHTKWCPDAKSARRKPKYLKGKWRVYKIKKVKK